MALYYYETKLGRLGVAEQDGFLTHVFFEEDAIPENMELKETPLLKEAGRQLIAYACGELKVFKLPLNPAGTSFQKQVWKSLLDIPYGRTVSYKAVAESIGNPKAMRAVGMANNRNPISIIIPCHRVIGADGSMIGYGGGIPLKEKMLSLEAEHR
jgi:methylated-DNA-[protein]-cysteine S-methyltransferase